MSRCIFEPVSAIPYTDTNSPRIDGHPSGGALIADSTIEVPVFLGDAHPLRDFRLKAGIDWILVEVEFSRPTQARWVRERMPEGFVNAFFLPLDPDPNVCRRFRFRIQDPICPEHVESMVRQLDPAPEDFQSSMIRVLAVEVFVDVTPKMQVALPKLAEAAEYLERHQAHPPPGKHIITSSGNYRAAARRQDLKRALQEASSVNSGEGQYARRLYVKRNDSKGKEAYKALPLQEWRARMEATLLGSLCPFSTLEQWADFEFAALIPYFRCVREDAPPTAFLGLLREQMVRLGKVRDFTSTRSARRIGRRGTKRDSQLNQRLSDALRGLTRRTQKCGNS